MAEMEKEGGKLSSNDRNNVILIYPNGDAIAFDRKVRIDSGWNPGTEVISNLDKIANLSLESKPKPSKKEMSPPKVDFLEFHEAIGHPNFAITRVTANAHGIDLKGHDDAPCASCAILKAQKKPVSKKEACPKVTLPAERLFLDFFWYKIQECWWA